ncbi:17654_t:CDS:1, partial [Rhizophagus irregularis]
SVEGGNLISLSDKSFFEEDGKKESITLQSFSFIEYSEYFLHKIGTTMLHHFLLTKRQECKDFLSYSSILIIRKDNQD